MTSTLPNNTHTDATRFDALCKVVIYNYCDVCQKKGVDKAVKLLIEQGVMEDEDDAEAAYTEYDELLVEYACGELPDEYTQRWDYWGAPCITNIKTFNAPKHDNAHSGQRIFYAGDTSGRIMLFENFLALQEYTTEVLEKIEHHED